MRLFIAIDLPEPHKAALHRLQASLTGGRPVPPDLFHVTLAFLGDSVGQHEAEDLHEHLDARHLTCPDLHLEGIGHFGHAFPRSIWVGARPADALERLHRKVVALARRTGFEVPRRRFVPHVTLVRYAKNDPGGTEDLARLFEQNRPILKDPFPPGAIHLMRSHLTRHGPDYEILASYPVTLPSS